MVAELYEIIDEKFRAMRIGSAKLQVIHTGALWNEGPVYFADGDYVVWSDIPNNRMLTWADGGAARVFRQPSNKANGNTRDLLGRLVTCEHGMRRVTRTEPDGTVTILCDAFEGGKLNSPNDVVVKSDGTIWFTDPSYGCLNNYLGTKGHVEQTANHVFRFDPNGNQLDVVISDMSMPNGLAFSSDETLLYVSDTGVTHDPKGPHHICAFEVADNGTQIGKRQSIIEVSPGCPDGFRLDQDGNIWTSAADGVHCYDPAGTLLGKIYVPEVVSNLTFGGPDRNRLFITGATTLFAIYVAQTGLLRP